MFFSKMKGSSSMERGAGNVDVLNRVQPTVGGFVTH
jgi:hypothetical protein